MKLKSLSNQNIVDATHVAVKAEKEATASVIRLFQEIFDRKIYLEYEHASMFEMVTKEFGFCNGSAQLRINAMKLICDVPAVEEKIASSEMLLTVATNVQSFLYLEKRNSRPYSENAKIELVEAQREFVRRNPEIRKPDTVRFVTEDQDRVSQTHSVELEEKLKRIKLLWSHVDPNMSREDVLDRMDEITLEQIDPLRKAKRAETRKLKDCEKKAVGKVRVDNKAPQKEFSVESVGEAESVEAQLAHNSLHSHEVKMPSRYIPAAENHAVVFKNSGRGCVFVSEITGERCGSHFQLQRDHAVPYSHGGSNHAENLRLYCAQHNRFRWDTWSVVKSDERAYR